MKILMILSCSKTNLKIDVHVIKKKQNKLKTKKNLKVTFVVFPSSRPRPRQLRRPPRQKSEPMIEALPVRVAPSMAGEAFNWKENQNDINSSKIGQRLHVLPFLIYQTSWVDVSFVSNSDKFDEDNRTKTNYSVHQPLLWSLNYSGPTGPVSEANLCCVWWQSMNHECHDTPFR